MLTADELDRMRVVLVRARNPNNIGAAARAMHDFGLRHLRVVNDFPIPMQSARSAVDASAVLADAEVCVSLADAVADCTLVVGTTAVGARALRHPLLSLPEAAPVLRAELRRARSSRRDDELAQYPAQDGDGPRSSAIPRSLPSGAETGRVALLFGSEKTGLSNDELSHCNWLLTVPMRHYAGLRHASMNLGQAVAVCLYELVRNESAECRPGPKAMPPFPRPIQTAADAVPPDEPDSVATCHVPAADRPDASQPATAVQLERLASLLSEVLEASGYARRHPASGGPAQLRRALRGMAPAAGDASVWMGVLRQILWKLDRAKNGPRQG